MKRTFQPSTLKRKRTHGFRSRMSTKAGRAILSNRRKKGRKELSAWSLISTKLKQYFYSSKNFRIFFKKEGVENIRISISKKIFSKAVDRNKIKRSVKEIFRKNDLYSQDGCFVFFVFKPFYKLKKNEASFEIINAVKSFNEKNR